jgi:hypothetical protein
MEGRAASLPRMTELVQRAPGDVERQRVWDVLAPPGERLQVKARVVTNPRNAGERQLSSFRSWDFDLGVIVLFDDRFRVWRAAALSAALLKQTARWIEHDRGWRVIANDSLLDQGEDWTEGLHTATTDD